MATLVFSALGTLVGGPLGGAIGALVGHQIDGAIIGRGMREGPRLKELPVTTASYGAGIARHFGRMRVPGTIIWATDIAEHKGKAGGGKGKPSTTTYSYTASFAVALASRPLLRIGRIWADGNLLRGAAGDFKTGGAVRFHAGTRDQACDPLIASAEGLTRAPAFRGTAYAVFEGLPLGDFGNRIPALSFEVFADDAPLTLAAVLAGSIDEVAADVPLDGIAGLSCEGAVGDVLAALDPVLPMRCDAAGDLLTLARERLTAPVLLGEPAIAVADDGFGRQQGYARKRVPAPSAPPSQLRYYDVDRDYQPGLQRAGGRSGAGFGGAGGGSGGGGGQPRAIELPAALDAATARALIEGAVRRGQWSRQSLSWRVAELDPGVGPGTLVRAPGVAGLWRVTAWEWREGGVELTLDQVPPALIGSAAPGAEPGRANTAPDLALAPTRLAAFELAWDGTGDGSTPAIYAAASAASAGWTGAALYVDHGDGALIDLGPSGRTRAIIGQALGALSRGSPHLIDRSTTIVVELADPAMVLADASTAALAGGANRALIGAETLQFGRAAALGAGRWRLSLLLRGRGGSEAAIAAHLAGEPFVLLDGTATALDPAVVAPAETATIAAIGLADSAAVTAPIAAPGSTLRPLSPVHPRRVLRSDGGRDFAWTRRARGAWRWPGTVEVPLAEAAEAWVASIGDTQWELSGPSFALTAGELASLGAAHPGQPLLVRQRGTYALSPPLTIHVFP